MPSGDWIIEEPQMVIELTEKLDAALELWESNKVKKFEFQMRKIIFLCPYHIDALHHLSLVAHERGRHFEELLIEQEAVNVILKLMIGIFDLKKDKLYYHYYENRPFHRAYYSYGLCLRRMNRTVEAIEVFENMLQINPDDNVGARYTLIKYYFETKQFSKVIEISKAYSNDATVDILYGKILAKYYLGRNDYEEDLRNAVKSYPKVAKEIIRMSHVRPAKEYIGKTQVITLGGDDEAFYYWENYGLFWLQAIDLHERLKETILDLKIV